MADIAAVVIQTLQWVGAPVTRQFQYLCCFSRNITSLRNEANRLEDTAHDLQLRVVGAENDSRVIYREVDTWLQDSKNIKDEMDEILNEVPNVESGCLKLGARFFLSRRAKKTTDRVKGLIILGQSKLHADVIAQPAAAAAQKEIPTTKSYEYESRKQIEEDIMATLRGGDVNMIGICGMGGLGKTTMAKKIRNRALEEHVFDEVVMVVVSRPIDKVKIQDEIGGSLGLKLQGECSEARVQKLHARLSGMERILLVLDDVWEDFVLEDLGIPSSYKGCTILLTSRNHDVLKAMNVQIFGMKVLSKEDSWIMFRARVGTCVDNPELNSVARKVVNECKGLPLALTAVGAALKDEMDVNAWKNAVGRLEKGDPDIPEFIAKVYNPLKLSYDVLERKYQDVFLLCCLYPEDAHIPLEQLTYFCMGLCMATGSVEAARNRIRALSKVLKSRSLLLDSERGDEYVRMHDVVRDVCIFIAKQKGYIGDNDLTSSLQIRYKLHSGFELLQIRNSRDKEINFDGISDLYVLSIECVQLKSLPFTQRPNNLITLVLHSCWSLETLSVVGELVNLEILICRDCWIGELPPEIKGLKRLKVLELKWCRNLQTIGRGIISSLVGLEELKMLKSFKKWEAEDREERENAGLRELGQLPNLRCLEIEIEDLALAAENIRLSSKIDRFTIRFLYETRMFSKFDNYLSNKKMRLKSFRFLGLEINRSMGFDEYLSNKKMRLKWEGATCLGDWIKMLLLRDTECLLLVGNGANEVGLTNLEKKIRYLVLGKCESMKKVVTSSMDKGGATVFPSLEHLLLFKLPKLEEICDDRISSNSFQNLKILKLDDLPVLKQLWMSSQNDLGKDFLPQLEDLYIGRCGMMETVFLWKGEDGNENTSCHHITKIFPKLKELWLENLPNLISLCQGIEGIEFPLLREMTIRGCGEMKGMSANGVTNNENNSGGTHHIFCESRVSFGCLKELDSDRNPFCSHTIHVSIFNGLEELAISTCAGSRSLFTSSMAGNLLNLKELSIEDCKEMVEVIKDDEEKGISGGGQRAPLLFPKLQTIRLRDLPNLLSFCESKGIESIQFPVLRSMEIRRCGKMKGMVADRLTSNENNSGGDSSNASDTIHLFCESQQVSFSELVELKISGCQGILSLFTSSMAGNLVNLKELRIEKCDEMVEVIKDDEEKGMSGGRQTALLFPKLQKLYLSNLPKLVNFCELKGIESIQFPVLRIMEITECGKMKGMVANRLTSKENNSGGDTSNASDTIHLFCESQQVSFGWLKKLDTDRNSFSELEELKIFGCQSILSLFTSSMAGNLVNLKTLSIEKCEEMVEVIKDEEEKGMSGGHQRPLLFPKLQSLELLRLPKLVSFCESKGIESIQFPVLRSMQITKCKKMKGMVANRLTSNENNSGGSNASDNIHLFCESQLVSFACLKKLDSDRNPFCSHTIHVSIFNGLEKLTISNCVGSLSLFTSSMAENLVNLKELTVEDCDEMVEAIKDDEEKGMSGDRQRAPLFPKLKNIKLSNLPNLVVFCEWKCDVELPSLRRVVTRAAPNMKNFILGSVAAPNLGSFETDLNNYLLQVLPFNIVKKLSVFGNEKPLNCYQIHGSVFDRLEELIISEYKGSMSLFSSSITGNLVNLTTLTIRFCPNMVKVIEEKEEEKEKVVSGAQRTTILFPKLHKILLIDLPELVRFCEWKCDVELPSLTELRIYRCNNMRSCTSGLLTTPNLKTVYIHHQDFSAVKDLNAFLQQQYFNRTEKKQAEKKKGGEEEQERKGETEEEQN